MRIIQFVTEPMGREEGFTDLYAMWVDSKFWNSGEAMEINKEEMKMLAYGFDFAIWLEETDEVIEDNNYFCNVYINNECKLGGVSRKEANEYIKDFKNQLYRYNETFERRNIL